MGSYAGILRLIAVVALTLGVWTPIASGQLGLADMLAAPATENAPGMRLELPFEAIDGRFMGGLVAERPLPIDIVVGPGEVTGQVLITFPQDITQQGAIIAPYLGSATEETRVRVVIACPPGFPSFTVQLVGVDATGADVLRRISVPDQQQMLQPLFGGGYGQRLVGVIGSSSILDAVTSPSRGTGLDNVVPVRFGRGLEPMRARELAGFTAFIVEPSALADWPERSRRALDDWLRSGGRLLVVEPPQSVIESIAGMLPVQIVEAVSGSGVPGLREELLAPGAAYRLTPEAIDDGWWLYGRFGTGVLVGTVASGPVGLGMLTLISIDPKVAGAQADLETSWGALLDIAGPVEHHSTAMANRFGSGASMRTLGSGGSVAEGFSMAQMIDGLADVEGSYFALLIAVAIVLGGLALMLGPGDWFILKRLRGRGRSWMTALGWIALASMLVYALPGLVSDRTASVQRVVMVHIDPDDQSVAHFVGVTAASSLKRFSIDVGAIPGSGSWWRGVAGAGGASSSPLLPTLAFVQAIDGAMAPAEPVDLADRSIRAFFDSGQQTSARRVRIERGEGARPIVRLDGFDDVIAVAIMTSGAPMHFFACNRLAEGEWIAREETFSTVNLELFMLVENARVLPESVMRTESIGRRAAKDGWARVVVVTRREGGVFGESAGGVESGVTTIYETAARIEQAP